MLSVATAPAELSTAPNCRRFLNVWQEWRGTQTLPTRADALPETLAGLLHAVTVIEVVAPEQLNLRLVATEIEEVTGRSIKGKNYVDLARAEDRAIRIERQQNIANTPCGAIMFNRLVHENGLTVSTQALFLPVARVAEERASFIYIAADVYRSDRTLLRPDAHKVAPVATDCRYVDIGFGVPT